MKQAWIEGQNLMIGDQIKKARKFRKKTRIELAKAFGMHPQSFGKWENGDRKMNAVDLVKLAILLEQPITYFYGYSDPGPDQRTVVLRITDEPEGEHGNKPEELELALNDGREITDKTILQHSVIFVLEKPDGNSG